MNAWSSEWLARTHRATIAGTPTPPRSHVNLHCADICTESVFAVSRPVPCGYPTAGWKRVNIAEPIRQAYGQMRTELVVWAALKLNGLASSRRMCRFGMFTVGLGFSMSVKSLVFSAGLALSVLTSGAQAATVTFEDVKPGLLVFGGGSEGGFDFSVQTGALYVNQWGNPGQDLEGDQGLSGGVVDFYASDLGLFTFNYLDYAAWNSDGVGTQTLTVRGWLGDTELGVDTFKLANSAIYAPTYDNWTLFGATNLAGVSIDRLSIELNAGGSYLQAIDNINLTSAIPEPATWAMMIVGFGLVGAMLRRGRTALAI